MRWRRSGVRAILSAVALLVPLLSCIGVGAAAAAPTAGVDTLRVEDVLERRQSALDSLLLPESTRFDTTGVTALADSLDRGGVQAIRAHETEQRIVARRSLQFGLDPLALTSYNRIDGSRPGLGAHAVFRSVRASAAGAYGFARHAWSGRAGVGIESRHGPQLRLDWSDLVEPFGPNRDLAASPVLALVAGQDRQDYLRRRSLEVGLWAWRRPQRALGLRLFEHRESSLAARTDFSLLGGGLPIDEPNPSIDAGTIRGLALQAHAGSPDGRARIVLEAGVTGGAAGGDFDYDWQSGSLALRHISPEGGVATLTFEGMNVAGAPPVQAGPYLGGDANLRGYDRLEFAGRQRASARFEYALGTDLLQRTRIPLVEKLHVQFIPFVDAGTTWGDVRAVAGSRGSLDGELRSSFGLGLQRTLWLPGLLAARLDLIRRTDGRGDGLAFWFRAVDLDL